jgi:hypothetical protein
MGDFAAWMKVERPVLALYGLLFAKKCVANGHIN